MTAGVAQPFPAGTVMNPSSKNRFDDFFSEERYLLLKNHLYNYLLRRRAIGEKPSGVTAPA